MRPVTSRCSEEFTAVPENLSKLHAICLVGASALSLGLHAQAQGAARAPATQKDAKTQASAAPAAATQRNAKAQASAAAAAATQKNVKTQSSAAPAQASKVQVPVHVVRHSERNGFIPPPPPVTPLGGQFIFVPSGGSLFLSETDVKKRRAELAAELKKAQDSQQEQDRRFAEKKDRCQQFDSLYKDGIISRREFESVQDTLGQAQSESEAAHQRVQDLQREIDAIDAQNKKFNQTTTIKKATSIADKNTRLTPKKVVKPRKN